MMFSDFLSFFGGLCIVLFIFGLCLYYAFKVIFSQPKKGATKKEIIDYLSRLVIVIYILYATIAIFLWLHYRIEINFSKITHALTLISLTPTLIGLIFIIPYKFFLIQIYLNYARIKYPRFKMNNNFPTDVWHYKRTHIEAFDFLYNREYLISETGIIFRIISELYRTLAIFILIGFFAFMLSVTIEFVASVVQRRAF